MLGERVGLEVRVTMTSTGASVTGLDDGRSVGSGVGSLVGLSETGFFVGEPVGAGVSTGLLFRLGGAVVVATGLGEGLSVVGSRVGDFVGLSVVGFFVVDIVVGLGVFTGTLVSVGALVGDSEEGSLVVGRGAGALVGRVVGSTLRTGACVGLATDDGDAVGKGVVGRSVGVLVGADGGVGLDVVLLEMGSFRTGDSVMGSTSLVGIAVGACVGSRLVRGERVGSVVGLDVRRSIWAMGELVGSTVVGRSVGLSVVGALVVGALVVGALVVGALVVGALVVGALVVGALVVGALVVGALVVGDLVGDSVAGDCVGGTVGVGLGI